jgi:hypothetical protein
MINLSHDYSLSHSGENGSINFLYETRKRTCHFLTFNFRHGMIIAVDLALEGIEC